MSSGPCSWFKDREGDLAQTGYCYLIRGPRQGRATGESGGQGFSPEVIRPFSNGRCRGLKNMALEADRPPQAAASSSLNEPRISGLPTLRRDSRRAVAHGRKAERDKIVESQAARGR